MFLYFIYCQVISMGRNAHRKRARPARDEDSEDSGVINLSCPQCGTSLPFVRVGKSSMVHVAHYVVYCSRILCTCISNFTWLVCICSLISQFQLIP